jgi:predicted DCC family thiol-disulfide oxidoreductase YuxK
MLLTQLKLDINDIDSVVYISGDKYFVKSLAVLHILRELGGGWRLLYSFIIIPDFIRDFFYNLIASNRYKIFGKKETCMIPTPEISERFFL